jgi:hypothetical protein
MPRRRRLRLRRCVSCVSVSVCLVRVRVRVSSLCVHRYYGVLAERFCKLKKEHAEHFDELFAQYYATVHRLETNKLRNVAKIFAHLLHTDALAWNCLECVRLLLHRPPSIAP